MLWKVVIILLEVHMANTACPLRCSCDQQMIDCSSRQLRNIPDDLLYQASLESPMGVPPLPHGVPPLPHGAPITQLTLANNQLHELPIQLSETLPHLQMLDLSNNKILYTRNVQNVLLCKQLLNFKLSSNPIKHLGLDKDTVLYSQSISHLDVSDCAISSITNEATFMFMMNLTDVNLSRNPLFIIDHLASSTVVRLDLSHCLFGTNDKGFRDEALINLPSLQFLNLSNNAHLTRIPFNKPLSLSLLHLDASYCALEKLDLRSFPNLHKASLRGNIIKVLNDNMLSNNIHLKDLELSENSIHHMEQHAFVGGNSLEYLDLSMNFMADVNWNIFTGARNVKTLNISRNLFAALDAIPLPSLLTLDASNCDIQRLSFNILTQMQALEDFNLSHNAIEVLPKMKSRKLYSLDLSFCRITDLHEETFQGLSYLGQLNLEGNRLTTPIKHSLLLHLQNVQDINLSDNPWTCDCNDTDFEYLWKYISSPPPKTKHLKALTCHAPKEMTGKPWNTCFQGLKSKDSSKHGMFSFLVPVLTLCCLLVIMIVIRQVYSAHELEARQRETQRVNNAPTREFVPRIAPHTFDEDMERGIQISSNESSQRSAIRELSKLPSYEEALLLPKPEDREDLHNIAKSYEESSRFEQPSSSNLGSNAIRPDVLIQPSTSINEHSSDV